MHKLFLRMKCLPWNILSAINVAWLVFSVCEARDLDLWCGACKGLFDEIEYVASKGL